uniref:Uncharacterized protein n=1 Tax=Bionectria ochroleuca TaxID=29856 RepID=A0A8H7NLW0_BIOOC
MTTSSALQGLSACHVHRRLRPVARDSCEADLATLWNVLRGISWNILSNICNSLCNKTITNPSADSLHRQRWQRSEVYMVGRSELGNKVLLPMGMRQLLAHMQLSIIVT